MPPTDLSGALRAPGLDSTPRTVAASCKQGTSGGLGGELFDPSGVATDGAGNVYVADSSNERIQKFDT